MSYIWKNKTVYFNGEEKGLVQDVKAIRDKLKKTCKLFEDDQFPADDSSLYFTQKTHPNYEWKRPGEISKDPRFIVDGPSRFDINQGGLGDCWFLAGMVNLATDKEMFSFVVPNEQSFQKDYAGVFQFRFWRQGRWIDVVIDDRLPTFNGKLVYTASTTDEEYWSALLEKAYAKIIGSYEALVGGETIESMVDLSGGVPEVYHLKEHNRKKLFDIFHKAYRKQAWLTCSTNPATEEEKFAMLAKYGIIPAHTYNLTDIKRVKFDDKEHKQKLVRVRNPWGGVTEWKGAYRDKADEWKVISEGESKRLNLEFKYDGEYWIHFSDFFERFDNVEICHLSRDTFSDAANEFDKNYLVTVHHSSWSIKDETAGGNVENKGRFKRNPQYRVTLKEPDICVYEDEDNGEDISKGLCTLIVSLMQKNRRKSKKDLHQIGFYVYLIPDPDKWPKDRLQNLFLHSHEPLYQSTFKNYYREVSAQLQLKPGTYLIVPCTDKADLEAEFMIRILTEKHANCLCILSNEILSSA